MSQTAMSKMSLMSTPAQVAHAEDSFSSQRARSATDLLELGLGHVDQHGP